jgi:hypothetical protein
MRPFLSTTLFCIFMLQVAFAQTTPIDKKKFFEDTSIINATITTNMSKLFMKNKQGFTLPGNFAATLPDSTDISEQIQMQMRGHFRHDNCYVPPVKLIFNNNKSSIISSLKSLKLVSQCFLNNRGEEYTLREYMVYKIYNLITNKSFRVRLLRLNFQDSSNKKKGITEYAFLLEDIKDVAKRNDCVEWKGENLSTEITNRKQMTLVALFQYMIGNTDWAVSVNHNTKLIYSDKDSMSRPFVVPYDFDYCGLVNAEYAVPDESLDIQNVRQRLYRGFPRTMIELNEAVDIFNQKKEKIYASINNFQLLNPICKKDLIGYLDGFFELIKRPKDVKYFFIDNSRTQ